MTKAIQTQIMLVLAAVVFFLCACPAFGLIEFKDGLTHDIDYRIDDDVWVDYESPGLETTLNILDGATISGIYYVDCWEDSIINILGGSIYQLDAYDSSQVAVSGGLMSNLGAYGSSQVAVSGGEMYYLEAGYSSQVTVSGGLIKWGGLWAYGSSQVAVSGGLMSNLGAYGSSQVAVSGGEMYYLEAGDSSQVTVSGGSMDELGAFGSSQVTVSGGWMDLLGAFGSSQVAVSGGLFGRELLVSDNAVLTIHGWDFAVDETPVGYTELYSIFGGSGRDEPHRQLTGTLLSGDPLNNQFRIGLNGKIVLVPEPASAVILGLGGFFLVLRRRRRQA